MQTLPFEKSQCGISV